MNDSIDKRVDEDWKRRAQLEKTQLDAQQRKGSAKSDDDAVGAEDRASLFSSFVQTLAAQTAMMLGLEPDPMTGATHANPDQARYLIDVIGMLEEKTRGNLNAEEARHLKMIMHELRMAFVEVTQRGRKAPR